MSVVVEERLYWRDRQFSASATAVHPQPHPPKTRHPRPQRHDHADTGRKGHVAAWAGVVRLMTNFTPQLTLSDFTAGGQPG